MTEYQKEQERNEYLRFRGTYQVGDGPDARGEVTVERYTLPDDDGEINNDRAFAEFVLEADRAVKHTREVLGLDDEDDEEL